LGVVELVVAEQPGRGDVVSLHGGLKEALALGAGVRLDVSATASLPPALAQLLVAAGRSAAATGQPFVLVSPRPELVDAFQGLGLFGDLMTLSME
jgi:anti-anti-sigma regulatory factor